MASGQVYVIRSEGVSTTITEVEVANFHGISCLKGKSLARDPNHWVSGTTSCIPLAQIQAVVVFESITDYTKAMQRLPAPGDKAD